MVTATAADGFYSECELTILSPAAGAIGAVGIVGLGAAVAGAIRKRKRK